MPASTPPAESDFQAFSSQPTVRGVCRPCLFRTAGLYWEFLDLDALVKRLFDQQHLLVG